MLWNSFIAISNWYYHRQNLKYHKKAAQDQAWKIGNISKFKTREEYENWKREKYEKKKNGLYDAVKKTNEDFYSSSVVGPKLAEKGKPRVGSELPNLYVVSPRLYWKERNLEAFFNKPIKYFSWIKYYTLKIYPKNPFEK